MVELAKALARIPSVSRVDLLTRMISDPKVDPCYGQPEERLWLDGPPPSSAATPRSSSNAAAAASAAAALASPIKNHTEGLLDAAVSMLGGGDKFEDTGDGGLSLLAAATNARSGVGHVTQEAEAEFVEPTGAFIVRLPAGPPEVYLR